MTSKTVGEELGPDALKDLFNASTKKDKTKLDLSPDESDKFSKAFDDPTFRKMFSEYMDEMNDPANRKENEVK
jgi:hypothetical protein